MKAKVRIKFQYEGAEGARKVAYLLEVDNRIAPRSLKVKTWASGRTVVTEVEHERLNTILATIDDLLFTEKLIAELLPFAGDRDA